MEQFKVGEFISYPGYGLGYIAQLVTKEVNSQPQAYYQVRILSNDLSLLLPVENQPSPTARRLRPLVQENSINQGLRLLQLPEFALTRSTWNQRYRDFMERINSGDFLSLAGVVREVHELRRRQNLSFGEKKMFDFALGLLAEEIATVRGQDQESTRQDLLNQLPK